MAFLRQNVLDTLGKGHYHSCLLTCYSFDFQFFELRVMRLLRAAGIQNVLVLTDGPLLEHLSATPSGREFQESGGFSIYPVYCPQGVFHPKVSLFFGAKEGLLAVGSGNLTAAGMGSNDEAWGCFHVADTTAANAALFADAWQYVQQLTSQVQGMAAVKVAWIKQYTPWLSSLPLPAPGTLHQLDNGLSAAFLTNRQQGILPQVFDLVDGDTVEHIVTVSPYYDQQGLALSHLLDACPAANLQCVFEERLGLLPTQFPLDQTDRISFHRWLHCGPQTDGAASRLHAKLVHFTTPKSEYLLLGSANVTAAAMGAGTVPARNEEASILLHHAKGLYLTGLGIRLTKGKGESLENLQKLQQHTDLTEEGGPGYYASLPIRITLAELEPLQLTLHLARVPVASGPVTVRLFSPRGLVHESLPKTLTNPLQLEVPALVESVNRVELVDNSYAVVGRQFVQHPASQQHYCPDPNRQKLQLGFDALAESGFEGLANLLDLLGVDSEDDESHSGANSAARMPAASATTSHKLTAEEFNQLKPDEQLRQQGLLNSAGVHISTFLNDVGKRLLLASPAEDYRESSEQGIDSAMDEGTSGTSLDVEAELQKLKAQQHVREQRSLDRFLARLFKAQSHHLKPVASAIQPQAIKLIPLTLRDFATFDIALHVAVHYFGRTYDTGEEGKQQKIYFMPLKGELYEYNTFKGFCAVFIGNFLLRCTADLEQYEQPLPLLQNRLIAVRQSCFEKALFLVLNAPWKDNETSVRDLLLANILHYLRPAEWALSELPSYLAASFEALSSKAKFECVAGNMLLYQLLSSLVPRLQALQTNLTQPHNSRTFRSAQAVKTGEWVFLSRLGICAVSHKYRAIDSLTLTLSKPGLQELSEEYGDCYRYQLQSQAKLITL